MTQIQNYIFQNIKQLFNNKLLDKELNSWLINTSILKKHFKKDLPVALKYRPKHGFAFPKQKIIFNKEILKKINDDYLLNKNFFYEKLENYKSNKKDYGQYLWNEITLNFMLQKKFKI